MDYAVEWYNDVAIAENDLDYLKDCSHSSQGTLHSQTLTPAQQSHSAPFSSVSHNDEFLVDATLSTPHLHHSSYLKGPVSSSHSGHVHNYNSNSSNNSSSSNSNTNSNNVGTTNVHHSDGFFGQPSYLGAHENIPLGFVPSPFNPKMPASAILFHPQSAGSACSNLLASDTGNEDLENGDDGMADTPDPPLASSFLDGEHHVESPLYATHSSSHRETLVSTNATFCEMEQKLLATDCLLLDSSASSSAPTGSVFPQHHDRGSGTGARRAILGALSGGNGNGNGNFRVASALSREAQAFSLAHVPLHMHSGMTPGLSSVASPPPASSSVSSSITSVDALVDLDLSVNLLEGGAMSTPVRSMVYLDPSPPSSVATPHLHNNSQLLAASSSPTVPVPSAATAKSTARGSRKRRTPEDLPPAGSAANNTTTASATGISSSANTNFTLGVNGTATIVGARTSSSPTSPLTGSRSFMSGSVRRSIVGVSSFSSSSATLLSNASTASSFASQNSRSSPHGEVMKPISSLPNLSECFADVPLSVSSGLMPSPRSAKRSIVSMRGGSQSPVPPPFSLSLSSPLPSPSPSPSSPFQTPFLASAVSNTNNNSGRGYVHASGTAASGVGRVSSGGVFPSISGVESISAPGFCSSGSSSSSSSSPSPSGSPSSPFTISSALGNRFGSAMSLMPGRSASVGLLDNVSPVKPEAVSAESANADQKSVLHKDTFIKTLSGGSICVRIQRSITPGPGSFPQH
eukprot:ANDGO_07112.mRNA.1 hypothetical protein